MPSGVEQLCWHYFKLGDLYVNDTYRQVFNENLVFSLTVNVAKRIILAWTRIRNRVPISNDWPYYQLRHPD